MTNKVKIDRINIGLIVVSFALAYFAPFHLFLFSYAILGPLHYLTEINWLRERNFFGKTKFDVIVLFAILVVIFIGLIPSVLLIVIAVAFASASVATSNWSVRFFLVSSVLTAFLGVFAGYPKETTILLVVFLPTIIHVFVFTLAFMINGALRANSTEGLLGAGLFTLGAVILVTFKPTQGGNAGEYITKNYEKFSTLSHSLVDLFGSELAHTITSPVGLTVARLLAFTYTYHYLNWFSKTTIIGWHITSRKLMLFIGFGWAVSIAFYAIDYSFGVRWLFFLSFSHVILELPLNVTTFAGIFKHLRLGQATSSRK